MLNPSEMPDTSLELEPFILNAEGMPLPGKDFVATAVAMGDPEPTYSGKKKSLKLETYGVYLEELYRRACFDPNFQLPIALKTGAKENALFVPGHRLGSVSDFGPMGNLRGPYPARVMVVGKVPSREDVQYCRHLNGPPGEVFYRALADLNVSDYQVADWYYTTVVKHGIIDRSSTRLSTVMIANCAPILEREIRLVNPQYILCMGSEAAAAVLGKEVVSGVGMAQGRVFDRYVVGRDRPIKVVVCANPSNVCRDEGEYPDFVTGLFRFVSLVDTGKAVEHENIDVVRIYSERHLKMVVDEILKHPESNTLAVDCEWHGDYPSEPGAYLRTLQFTHKVDKAYIVVFRKAGGVETFLPDRDSCISHLKRLFLDTPDRKVRLVGHNLRADLPWIFSLDGDLGRGMAAQYTAPDDDVGVEYGAGKTGAEKTLTEGGFDTMIAAHAIQEVAGHFGYKLEILTSRYCGVPRWDIALQEWKKSYCHANSIKEKELEGYGECPDDVLLGSIDGKTISYAGWDVAGLLRLYKAFNDPGGNLDCDRFGNNCRKPFWIAMRASPAFLEMEQTGMKLFPERAHELTLVYRQALSRKLAELRAEINWPTYNPNSVFQTRDLLFGPGLSGRYDSSGSVVRVLPSDVVPLRIEPLVATGKPPKQWKDIVARGEQAHYSPATSKEVLTAYLETEPKDTPAQKRAHKVVSALRDIRFINSLLARVLAPEEEGKVVVEGEDEEFDRGLASWVHADGLIRSHFFPTQETGRCSTVRPPLQNLCLDPETEYLTDRGWVKVTDFQNPMKVAQYDPQTSSISFVSPSHIHSSHYEGPMYHWCTEYVDLLLTPNHRLPIRYRDDLTVKQVTADATLNCTDRFIVAGVKVEGFRCVHAYAKFIGIICAAGAHVIDRSGFKSLKIYVSEHYAQQLIIEAAASAGLPLKLRGINCLMIDQNSPGAMQECDKLLRLTGYTAKLGPWLLQLDALSMNVIGNYYRKWYNITKKPRKDYETWLEIIDICNDRRLPSKGGYRSIDTAIHEDEAGVPPSGQAVKKSYKGMVYCVTVPKGWIVVRRNGRPCVVGNSKNREADYQVMLGDDYKYPIRSMLGALPGWVMVEADFIGAELYTVAVQSGSTKMADHCSRSELPDSDPNKYDIHSSLAVFCFRLTVDSEDIIKSAAKKLGVPRESLNVKVGDPLPANKTWLSAAGKKGLRDAVKAIVFGLLYGRSDQAVVNAVEQQGIKLTLSEAGDIRNAIFMTYPELHTFMEKAQARVTEEGWMANWCGRYRRFGQSSDRKLIGEMQRQAGNFGIQSGVADLVNLALAALYRVPDRFDERGPRFLMALQVHDAIMFHVRPDSLEWFLGPGGHDGVLQRCMSGVPMKVADFNGNPVPGKPDYHLPAEWSVMVNWGVPLTREQGLQLKVPEFLIPDK